LALKVALEMRKTDAAITNRQQCPMATLFIDRPYGIISSEMSSRVGSVTEPAELVGNTVYWIRQLNYRRKKRFLKAGIQDNLHEAVSGLIR
jgi:hypothetical protein